MKPLACCTNYDREPDCTQAFQQPDSPVTQAGSSTSPMPPYRSSTTTDFAEDSVCQQHGTVCPAAHLNGNSSQQQTASKHVRAQARHNEGSRRKQLSSTADMSAACPPQDLLYCEREAGTAGTAVKGGPRPSSWQRRKAAKLRQAQQDNQGGKSSCPIHIVCVHNLQQEVTNCHMAVSLPSKVLCLGSALQCGLLMLRPVQWRICRGRRFRAAAAQASTQACHAAVSSYQAQQPACSGWNASCTSATCRG